MVSKSCVVLCCLLVAVIAEEKYTSKYDNTNLKEIMENERLFLSYVNCILDKGKCTPAGKELRENIPDAIETGCEKCTDTQAEGTKAVIKHLIENKPEIWKEVTAKYDPKGTWRQKYEEYAKENGIVIPEE